MYELTVRGIVTRTVEKMRGRLIIARQMEKVGESMDYPEYPYTFEQDSDTMKSRLVDLKKFVEVFKDTNKSHPFLKTQSKLAHVLERSDNMTPTNEDDSDSDSVIIYNWTRVSTVSETLLSKYCSGLLFDNKMYYYLYGEDRNVRWARSVCFSPLQGYFYEDCRFFGAAHHRWSSVSPCP